MNIHWLHEIAWFWELLKIVHTAVDEYISILIVV